MESSGARVQQMFLCTVDISDHFPVGMFLVHKFCKKKKQLSQQKEL